METANLNNSKVVITFVTDESSGKSGKLVYLHSNHSDVRSQQRGLNDNQISFALQYGKEIFKQGLIFFVVRDKDIPEHIKPQSRKQYKNIVLITSSDGSIITCYKSKKAHKSIKLKKKRLGRRKIAA